MRSVSFWDNVAVKYAADPISDLDAYEVTLNRMRGLLQRNHNVLELGCGTGSTALELAGDVASYLGTDISPKMIDIARSKQSEDTPEHLQFNVGEAIPLPNGAFDVILALNVLHLVPKVEKTIAHIFAALPPGGLFITKTSLIGRAPFYVRGAIPIMRMLGKAPNVQSFGQSSLERLLTDAGFEVSETLLQPGMVPRLFVVARRPG